MARPKGKKQPERPRICTGCGVVLSTETPSALKQCQKCLDGEPPTQTCRECAATYVGFAMPEGTPNRCPACRRQVGMFGIATEPVPPPGKTFSPVEQELARRALARKYLIWFVKRHDPGYKVGWFHKDLADRLEQFLRDVEAGKSPRLMVQVPPRHGKSRLASTEFPAWALGLHPEWEFITASYASPLAIDFSRAIRERLRDESYQATFPHTALHPDSQSVESWRTTRKGGFFAAGVGGPITGRGANILIIDDPCIAEGTPVLTARGWVPIEAVVVGDMVLTHRSRWRPVLAVHDNGPREVVRLAADDTNKLLLTPEHLVYTSDGWIPATEAKDVYTVQAMRGGVQGAEKGAVLLQSGVSWGFDQGATKNVPCLQRLVSASQRFSAKVLRACLRTEGARDAQGAGVQGVRHAVSVGKERTEVLLPGVSGDELVQNPEGQKSQCGGGKSAPRPSCPPRSAGDGGSSLRLVRRVLCAWAYVSAGVLRAVQKRIACGADAREAQPQLSARAGGRSAPAPVSEVPVSAASAGVPQLRGVREPGLFSGASPGRKPDQRRAQQFDCAVRLVPHAVSQITRHGVERVYDLTVDEDHSFVAGGVVVHNCKNSEEAESKTTRDAIWNWYTSTAYTRLAPGAGVLTIQTRWHVDDLSGRLEHQMVHEEGETWEIVRYPALATEDEAHRKTGEALHPERYDEVALRRIKKAVGPRTWNALYQQNPVPDEGAYFTRSMFRYYERAPELLHVYNTWDLAIGQKQQNDWSVGMKWGVDPNDNIYILDVLRGRFDAMELVDHILDMWKSHPETQACGIEEGQIKMTLGPYLEQRVKERRMHSFYQVSLKPGKQDKMARARTIQGRMRQGQVYFPESAHWLPALMDELLTFPFGKHDDQCVTGDTRILTPQGEVPIASIRPGDQVLTHLGVRPVIAQAQTAAFAEVYEVELTDGSTIRCTGNHPFVVVCRGLVPAVELQHHMTLYKVVHRKTTKESPLCPPYPADFAMCVEPNSNLTEKLAGIAVLTVVGVVAVRKWSRPEAVYNLTVEGAHTYYANGVLTHNCDALAYAGLVAADVTPPSLGTTSDRPEQGGKWLKRVMRDLRLGTKDKSWMGA